MANAWESAPLVDDGHPAAAAAPVAPPAPGAPAWQAAPVVAPAKAAWESAPVVGPPSAAPAATTTTKAAWESAPVIEHAPATPAMSFGADTIPTATVRNLAGQPAVNTGNPAYQPASAFDSFVADLPGGGDVANTGRVIGHQAHAAASGVASATVGAGSVDEFGRPVPGFEPPSLEEEAKVRHELQADSRAAGASAAEAQSQIHNPVLRAVAPHVGPLATMMIPGVGPELAATMEAGKVYGATDSLPRALAAGAAAEVGGRVPVGKIAEAAAPAVAKVVGRAAAPIVARTAVAATTGAGISTGEELSEKVLTGKPVDWKNVLAGAGTFAAFDAGMHTLHAIFKDKPIPQERIDELRRQTAGGAKPGENITGNITAAGGGEPSSSPPPSESKTRVTPAGEVKSGGGEPAPSSSPPPPPNTVRMYHGGQDYNGGPRWVTPDRAYAEGYVQMKGGKLFSVDVPANSQHLVKSFDDTGSDVKSPYLAFNAPEEIARNLKEVPAPSPTADADQQHFQQWLAAQPKTAEGADGGRVRDPAQERPVAGGANDAAAGGAVGAAVGRVVRGEGPPAGDQPGNVDGAGQAEGRGGAGGGVGASPEQPVPQVREAPPEPPHDQHDRPEDGAAGQPVHGVSGHEAPPGGSVPAGGPVAEAKPENGPAETAVKAAVNEPTGLVTGTPHQISPPAGDAPTSLAATDQRLLEHYDRHHADADAEQENADHAAAEDTGGAATTFRRDPKTKSGFPREIEDQFTPEEMARLKQRGILRIADGSHRLTGHEAAGGADAMGEAGMGADRYVAMLRRRLDDSQAARLDRAIAFAKDEGGDPHMRWLAGYRETLLPPGERPPQVSIDPKAQPVGTEMTVNGIPVKVASEGGETILKDHGDLPDTPVEHLDGPIAVDKGSVKAPGERKSFLDRIADAGDAAMARIAQRNTGATPKSGLDPRDAADFAMVGAGLLAKGVRGLKSFTEELAKLIGEHVRPHARDVYRQSRDIFLKERTADEVYERAAAEQLKGRTVGGGETTRQTVRRTSGQTDRSPATGATESEALAAKLKAQAAGARAGYREGAADATAAERNRQATREYSAPETVPLSKAIKASMTIRAQGEAAVAKLKDKMEVGQDVRDQLTAAAQELPREIRGDFLTAVRDARTPINLHRALDRMDAAIVDYRQRAATRDLLDVVGRAAKDKPAEQKLVSKVEELAGVKKPERPVRVDPAKMRPEHEAAVAPLVKAIRTEGKATGAAGLARFINEQTEAGRSNAFDKPTLSRLFHLEGKPLGSMAPEDMELIGNAVQHVANLSDRYNKVEFAGRMVDASRAGDRIMAEVAKRHAEPLADENRTPEKSSVARAVGDVHRDLSRLAITAGGKPAEEAFYTNIYKGENAANGLKFEAQDAMKAVREEHGIKDADLVKLSNDRVEVPLAGGRRPLSLTPMERAEFVAHWEDADTRQEILKAGFVPKRFKGTPSRVVRVDAADAQAIVDSATPFERAYAAKAREFLNGPMREAVNAASVKDVGFAVARKDDYFPRSRDMTGSNIRPDQKGWHQAWLENIGALKERTGSAKSPVVVGNLHETFDRHVDQTSRYAHLSAPVRDALYLLGGGGGEPGIGQDLVERLGPKWRDRVVNYLHTVSGMKPESTDPLLGPSKAISSAIAVGELGFRVSSAINHWAGGTLFAHDLDWADSARLLGQLANPKNIFDNAYHQRMVEASPYFRTRHEQSGVALTNPAAVGDTIGQIRRGPGGQAYQWLQDKSMAMLKAGDARDVVSLAKTLEGSYRAAHPDATPEEAFKAAMEKAEYVVRRNGTAASPLDMSSWNLKAKQSAFGNIATLFSSKINKFRNAVDESIQEVRADPKSGEKWAKLVKTTALVGLNTWVLGEVRSFFGKQARGFPELDQTGEQDEAWRKTVERTSELADMLAPGAGVAIRSGYSLARGRGMESPTIVGSTAAEIGQNLMATIHDIQKSRNDQAVIHALKLAATIGRLSGVPIDAPTGYGIGLYRQFAGEQQSGAGGARTRSHPHQRGR